MDIANSRKDVPGSAGTSYIFGGARIVKTSSQTMTTGAFPLITFDSSQPSSNEHFDTASYWSSANPSRLTIAETGYYLLWAHIKIAGNATGIRRVFIRRSDGVGGIDTVPAVAATFSHEISHVTMIDATAAQYFEFYALQASGGDLACTAAEFGVCKLP